MYSLTMANIRNTPVTTEFLENLSNASIELLNKKAAQYFDKALSENGLTTKESIQYDQIIIELSRRN